MRQQITPQRFSKRSGLLAAFPPRLLDLVTRSDMAPGFVFGTTGRYEPCERPARFRRGCFPGPQSGAKNTDTASSNDAEADPFAIYVGLTSDCIDGLAETAQGGNVALTDLGARLLDSQLSDAIERELWGLAPVHAAAFTTPPAQDYNVGGHHLTDDGFATVVGTAAPAPAALAALQQAWADCAGGSPMIVLAPTWVATALRVNGVVAASMTTPGTYDAGSSTIVIEGSGFWGVAPLVGGTPVNTSRNWIFAVRGLDVFATPAMRSVAFDVASNEFAAVVERHALVSIDPCCVLATEVAP